MFDLSRPPFFLFVEYRIFFDSHKSDSSMIGTNIYNDLETFHEAVKGAFQGRATSLPIYQPSTGPSSWQNFVTSLRVPQYSELPMLMLQTFRDVRSSDQLRAQLSHIFCRGQHKSVEPASASVSFSSLHTGCRKMCLAAARRASLSRV